jgi:MFS family permease
MLSDSNQPRNSQSGASGIDPQGDNAPTSGDGERDRVPGRSDPYLVWRNPNLRLFAASWFLMIFGKMVETVAVGVHIYRYTHDALSLGLVGLVQALPVLLLAIPGGQIADRYDRRRVILTMLVASSAVSVGLALAARHDLPVHWFFVLLCAGAVSQALGSPSRAALLPQIVDREVFSSAVAWSTTVFHVAAMTGPAVGGLVVGARANTTAAFALVTACRVLSAAALLGIRTAPAERAPDAVSLESLVAGIRFVWRTPLILAAITLDLFAVLLGGATYLLPIFAEDILGVGAQGLGLLRSAEAVGAVSMGVLLAHLPPMRKAGWALLWAVAGFGCATVGLGLSRLFPLSLAMMFFIGAFDNVSVVVRHTLVQMLTPDAMRGRVSAINNIFIVASNDLGGLESGATAWLFGPVISVVGGGIGAILVVLAAARIWPGIFSIGSLADIGAAPAARVEEDVDEELAQRM